MKLFSFDIDNTLTNHEMDLRIPHEVVDKINELSKNNMILINTGRPYKGAKNIHKQIIQNNNTRYVSGYTGGVVGDVLNEKILFEAEITKEQQDKQLEIVRELRGELWCLSTKIAYTFDGTFKIVNGNEIDNPIVKRFDEMDTSIMSRKFLVTFDSDDKFQIYFDKMKKTFGDEIEIALPNDDYNSFKLAETTPGVANKYNAIEIILERHPEIEMVLSFGDSLNDYQMIKKSQYGIAMGNSHEKLYEIADFITKSVWEHGTLHAIEKFESVNWKMDKLPKNIS